MAIFVLSNSSFKLRVLWLGIQSMVFIGGIVKGLYCPCTSSVFLSKSTKTCVWWICMTSNRFFGWRALTSNLIYVWGLENASAFNATKTMGKSPKYTMHVLLDNAMQISFVENSDSFIYNFRKEIRFRNGFEVWTAFQKSIITRWRSILRWVGLSEIQLL